MLNRRRNLKNLIKTEFRTSGTGGRQKADHKTIAAIASNSNKSQLFSPQNSPRSTTNSTKSSKILLWNSPHNSHDNPYNNPYHNPLQYPQ